MCSISQDDLHNAVTTTIEIHALRYVLIESVKISCIAGFVSEHYNEFQDTRVNIQSECK